MELMTTLNMAVAGLALLVVGWAVRGWFDKQAATRKPRLIERIMDDLTELEGILKPDPADSAAIGEAAKEANQLALIKTRVAALP